MREKRKLLAIDPKASGRLLFTTENIIGIYNHDKPGLIANILGIAASA